MSVSDLSFSATLSPFNYTNGFGNNFSNANLSLAGNLSVATGGDSANGSSSPTVLSSVTANGENFAASSASFNGNLLTVNYLASDINNSVTDPSTVNINGNGVNFSPQGTHATGATLTTTYATSPNSSYNNAIPGAAISTGSSTDNQNYTLESLALVGNSLVATYQVTNGAPSDQTNPTPNPAPSDTGIVSVASPSAINTSGPNSTSKGISTIGDLLANANGLTLDGTLTGALQQPPSIGSATGYPNGNSVLAATLNPSLDLSPDTSLQVTDFVNASPNAFPTSAPPNTFADNSNNSDNSNNTNNTTNNSFATGYTAPTPDSQSNPTPSFGGSSGSNDNSFSSAAVSVGVYSAISNANASTIRGSGVDTVA